MASGSRQARTAFSVTLVAVVLVGIVAAAAVFSIARGAQEVAGDGATGILAEATLSAAAATHNAVSQAQVVAEGEALGVASSEDLETTFGRADEAIAELDSRTRQVLQELGDGATGAVVASESQALRRVAEETVAAIEQGQLDRSLELVGGDLRTNYEALVLSLVDIRNDSYSQISLTREDMGRLADAARFVVVLLVPIVILIVYRSRIRRLQAQQELEADLEKEQAVSQTKSEFISHMSHELRTPLTSIYGSALELHDPAISSNTALSLELTSMITEEAAELARMVEDILAVAAEDQDQLTVEAVRMDPVTEIGSILEPLEVIGRKTMRHVAPGDVMADPRHFRQVISNLVSNAHRYGLSPVVIKGSPNGSAYVLEVIDHGPGVGDEVEDKLFNRFVHDGDSPLITGTVGLGLSVAEILVTRMDGSISYDRRDNTTVFSVRLPLANQQRR
ncbi:MAG: HAMP domain-containing sensor histidine kinase [Acidimicrobiia bacterium]|nr:HAMP domain-containing sensor histidine kinase [Acidimicrobiia bacterium]